MADRDPLLDDEAYHRLTIMLTRNLGEANDIESTPEGNAILQRMVDRLDAIPRETWVRMCREAGG